MMARSSESLKRTAPKFAAQPTVLIVCEDKVSSKTYLEDAALWYRSSAKVEVVHSGVTHPLGIVEYAIKNKKRYDVVYCSIDRDSHESFDEALRLADRHHDVEIIASYPCFEIWLLIHFGACRKPYEKKGNKSAGDCVGEDLRAKPGMKNYEKGNTKGIFSALLGPPLDTARKAAPKMLIDAYDCGDMNPSTTIHLLVDEIEKLGMPQKIVAT